MNFFANESIRDNIGNFIDRRVQLPSGDPIPRNIPYYKEAFLVMINSGVFNSIDEIKRACLLEEHQMIPDFLFENCKNNK